MSSDIFQSTTVKIFLAFLFLIHAIAHLLTIYFVLYVIEKKLFLNYASVLFAEFYVSIFEQIYLKNKGKFLAYVGDYYNYSERQTCP